MSVFASASMRFDHRFTARHASAFVDRELGPRAMERVRRHLGVCPMCAEMIRSLRATVAGVRSLREHPPHADAAAEADADAIVPIVLEALRRAETERPRDG